MLNFTLCGNSELTMLPYMTSCPDWQLLQLLSPHSCASAPASRPRGEVFVGPWRHTRSFAFVWSFCPNLISSRWRCLETDLCRYQLNHIRKVGENSVEQACVWAAARTRGYRTNVILRLCLRVAGVAVSLPSHLHPLLAQESWALNWPEHHQPK